jgi:phasin family protein
MASKIPGSGSKKPVGKVTPPAAKVSVPFADISTQAPVAAAPLPAMDAAPMVEAVAETAGIVADGVTDTVEQVVPVVTETIEQTATQAAEPAAQGKDIMETTIEKTQAMFADLNEKAKAQVEKQTKLVGEATEFAKGNVEALVESGKIAAKGFETLGQDAADYGRRSFEHATAALKSMSAVKSPADFFKLQSDYVRASFDSMVAETSKTTEAMIKLAGDAAQPISSRVALAVEKAKVAA